MPIEMPRRLPFSVDTWTPSSKRKRHHFLTHAHKDHAQGISAHASFPIYSTLITTTLIRRYYPQVDESIFVRIEIGQSLSVEDPDGDFTVTAFDANHCPGLYRLFFTGKKLDCSNLMEKIPNRCVEAQSEPVVLSTRQRKRLSMSPPSKRPMLTLFGRARLGLQDSILQREQNEIVSMGCDSLERASTEEVRSSRKEKVIKVKLQGPLESNGIADHELGCISSVGIEGTTRTKFEVPLESERMANRDENLRRFYRTIHTMLLRFSSCMG